LLEERSIDVIDAHKANQSKFSNKVLNISNQSMVSNYQRDSYIQEDLKEKSIELQANKENKGIQSDLQDDSIFPPFDHRVCLRCKKNDLTSPNHCKYSNLQKLEDLSFQSNKSSMSYKVSKNHIYGVNVGFKSKIEVNPYENLFKKDAPAEFAEKGMNTIISNNDFASQDLSDLKEEDLLELKTPRTDTKREY